MISGAGLLPPPVGPSSLQIYYDMNMFNESDWAVDENHSINNKSGGRGGGVGPPTIRRKKIYAGKRFPKMVIPDNAVTGVGFLSDLTKLGDILVF
ncbi:hypothetical protein CDAR_597221 [Caerostris darwini]|uniref:Uncharacterized protein n=1 Tax=Caerostris darwini TaxID=1538125 RepID=A0AAV4U2D1_9ARAC|nr:hypothetical protein CDAR_597221 [Caerostris darwini]